MKLHALDYVVLPTSIEKARDLVRRYHYAVSCNRAVTYVFGLFLNDRFPQTEIAGCSVWQPAVKGSVDKYNPGGERTSLTLTRFVIAPDVPKNAASYLLGGSIRQIKQDGRFNFLITYADTYRGHTGTIYRATNWVYRGLSNLEPVWVMPDGSIKSRYKPHGGSNAHDEMLAKGAIFAGRFRKHVFTMGWKFQKRTKPYQLKLMEVMT